MRKALYILVTFAVVARGTSAGLAQTCGGWTVVDNPVFQDTEFLPRFMSSFGLGNAVGLSATQGGAIVRLTWDGSAWVTQPTGPVGLSPVDMRGAEILGSQDIWICGFTVADAHGRPFLAHWNGQSWDAAVATVIDYPDPAGGDPLRNAEASDIAVIAPDDIWTVGAGDGTGVGGVGSGKFVACHWDGSSFEEVALQPNIYGRINLVQDVDAAATDDIWAVGHGRNVSGSFHLAMYHYDGSSWTPTTQWTPLPGQNVVSETLYDVVTPDRDDAWAVGEKLVQVDLTIHAESLYLHWDGSGWTEVSGPNVGPLTSVADNGPDDIWAVCGFGEYGGRMAHWDGTAWTEFDSATFPGATHIGLSDLAVGPDGEAWAAGYWAIYDGQGGWASYENVTELFVPGCSGDLDGDGDVDLQDLATLLAAYPTCAGDPGYDAGADLDGSGCVDLSDLATLLANYGMGV